MTSHSPGSTHTFQNISLNSLSLEKSIQKHISHLLDGCILVAYSDLLVFSLASFYLLDCISLII